MSLTAFVTGASGFVGSNLARELHRQGWTVHVLMRPTSRLADIEDVPSTIHHGDVTDPESVRRAIPRGADAVFHVAASTNLWSRNNPEQTRINVDGTRHVLEAAQSAGAGRFIFTSSFVTWGFQDGVLDEDTPRSARSDWINYVRTKALSEDAVRAAAADGKIDAVVLNPANVLGPGDRHNWSRLIRMVHRQELPGAPPGGGSFCDVREVARAHVRAFHRAPNGERYLLGGEFARYLEIIAIAGELLDRPVPSRPSPAWLLKTSAQVMTAASLLTRREPQLTPESAFIAVSRLECDSGKAERELDYRAVPLRDMVADTIEWMDREGLLG